MGGNDGRASSSPVRYVEAIKSPILLIHGENDDIVPIEQSEIMERALKKAGKDVTFVRIPNEDHSLLLPARADMFRKVEAFLAEHIGQP